jgi:general stress protein YciG
MVESKKVGFAAMAAEKQREIASAGGKAAHAKGTAHEFTAEEASEAGRAGGKAALKKLGREHFQAIGRKGGAAVSTNREHMRKIGCKGGHAVSGDREHMAEIGRKSRAVRLVNTQLHEEPAFEAPEPKE